MIDFLFGLGLGLLVIYVLVQIYKAILRTASFNPVSWIWGPRLYGITQLDQDDLLVEVNQFPNDEYMIDWRVTMTESYRDKGPWFARKKKLVSFDANWAALDHGIPTNHGYIKDTWSGSFQIKDPFDWRYDACKQLEDWIKSERHRQGYVGQISNVVMDEEGLKINGVIFDDDLQKLLQEGVVDGLSISEAMMVEPTTYDGFGAPISNPGEITTSTSDNDLLKSKYTLEELAQQAINRDKDQDD